MEQYVAVVAVAVVVGGCRSHFGTTSFWCQFRGFCRQSPPVPRLYDTHKLRRLFLESSRVGKEGEGENNSKTNKK